MPRDASKVHIGININEICVNPHARLVIDVELALDRGIAVHTMISWQEPCHCGIAIPQYSKCDL